MRPTDPRLVRRLRPAARPLAGVVSAGVVSSLLVLAQAWILAGVLVALAHGTSVRAWAVAVVAVFAARALAGVVSDVAAAHAAGAVGTAIRRDLMRGVLAPSGTRHESTGETAVLVTRGVAAAEPYLTRYLPALVLAGVLPPLTVVAIATQDVTSAVIVLATLPLVPVFGILVGMATRDRAERQWRAMASLSGHFLDVVRGLPTLVAFRRAEAQTGRIREVTDRYRRASMATLKTAFASSAVLETVATLSVALVAVTVGVRLAGGSMDLHPALVVLLLAPEAYWPLRRVGAEFHAAAEGVATFERVDALLSRRDDTVPSAGGIGDLVVSDVTVRYPGRAVPALDRVSLTVPAIGLTALTGPSGCGKSTLLSLLAGLLAPDAGGVRVGGLPVSGERWREQVALLPQRPVFVAGTLADNVRLGAPDAPEEAVWEVLRGVDLEQRVRALPQGLHTKLGEDGATLSAGERARLALARVVLSDRPWVLLDEPTAHLDPLTERVVADTLADLARRRGVVVVTHRPEVIAAADRVVVLPLVAESPASARRATAGTGVEVLDLPGVPEATRAPRLMMPAVVGGLASASGVALTATSGWLIVQASTRPAVLTLLVAIVAVRAFGLARPALRYVERLWSHDVALRLLASRRAAVYDALVPLTPGRLGPRRGDVLASVVDDVDSVLDRELRDRLPLRGALLVGLLATVVLGLVEPGTGLLVAAVMLVAGTSYLLVRAGTTRAERSLVAARARLSERVVEATQVADELVIWQAGERAVEGVVRAGEGQVAGTVRSAWMLALGRAATLLACGFAVAGVTILVAPQVDGGDLGAPVAALLVLVPLALAEVVVPLADAGAASSRARAAEARLDGLLAHTPAVLPPAHAVELPEETALDVAGVTAGWDDDHPAFRDLALDVPAGGRVAVVGQSGSGKSTLAALLLRFLDPSRGSVSLGGVRLPQLGLDDVRQMVGLVDDDPHVFATTVAENIRLARPGADDLQVEVALRDAGLGRWLDDLTEGLDTRLGDGAAGVSGGERARLGVARSLLADQGVLVLDEPTSHLDHASAELLADQVLGSGPGGPRRSVVWITHEPVGLDRVDAVVDLGGGPAARLGRRPAAPDSPPGSPSLARAEGPPSGVDAP